MMPIFKLPRFFSRHVGARKRVANSNLATFLTELSRSYIYCLSSNQFQIEGILTLISPWNVVKLFLQN